jgi:glutamyl-tRNA reductase
LVLCNRDFEKAQSHAEKFSAEAAPLSDLESLAAMADVMITSPGSERPLLTRRALEPIVRHRRGKPIFLIDIALPRDVEPSVGELDNVYLYNIDDLQKVVAASASHRGTAVPAATAIVTSAVDEFFAWHRARQNGPMIDDLYKRGHALAREELARTLSRLPDISTEERGHLEDLARRIVNKLLHERVKSLRAAHGTADESHHESSGTAHGDDHVQTQAALPRDADIRA